MLQALLSKMTAACGTVHVGAGAIAYVPQTPWVQNLSLRDNILFGLPFDQERYSRVVHAAALELDLKILPNGEGRCGAGFRLGLELHAASENAASERFLRCMTERSNPTTPQATAQWPASAASTCRAASASGCASRGRRTTKQVSGWALPDS